MATRGSGSVEQRISNLKGRLSEDEIIIAQELSKTHKHEILKLASYFISQSKSNVPAPQTEDTSVNA